jgi:hypothetical protein
MFTISTLYQGFGDHDFIKEKSYKSHSSVHTPYKCLGFTICSMLMVHKVYNLHPHPENHFKGKFLWLIQCFYGTMTLEE